MTACFEREEKNKQSIMPTPDSKHQQRSWNRGTKVNDNKFDKPHECVLPPAEYRSVTPTAADSRSNSRSASASDPSSSSFHHHHHHPPATIKNHSHQESAGFRSPSAASAGARSSSIVSHHSGSGAASSAAALRPPLAQHYSKQQNHHHHRHPQQRAVPMPPFSHHGSGRSASATSFTLGERDGSDDQRGRSRSAGGGGNSRSSSAYGSAGGGGGDVSGGDESSQMTLAWEREKQAMLRLSSEQMMRKSLQMHFDVIRLRRKRAQDAAHVHRLRRCREFISACAECVQDATLRLAVVATPDSPVFEDPVNSSPLAKILHATKPQLASTTTASAAAAAGPDAAAEQQEQPPHHQTSSSSPSSNNNSNNFFRSTDPEEDAGSVEAEPHLSKALMTLLDALACAETSSQQMQEIAEREKMRADHNAEHIVQLDDAVRSLQAGRVELINMHAASTEQYELRLSDLRIQIQDAEVAHKEDTASLRQETIAQANRIADLEQAGESLQINLENEQQLSRQLAMEKEAAAASNAAQARMLREALDTQSRELGLTSAQLHESRQAARDFACGSTRAALESEEALARMRAELEALDSLASLRHECFAGVFKMDKRRRSARRTMCVATEQSDQSDLVKIVEHSKAVIDAVHEQIFELSQQLDERTAGYEHELHETKFDSAFKLLVEREAADRAKIMAAAEKGASRALMVSLFIPPDVPETFFSMEYSEEMCQTEDVFVSSGRGGDRAAGPAAATATTEHDEGGSSSGHSHHSGSDDEGIIMFEADEEVLLNQQNWHNVLADAWAKQPKASQVIEQCEQHRVVTAKKKADEEEARQQQQQQQQQRSAVVGVATAVEQEQEEERVAAVIPNPSSSDLASSDPSALVSTRRPSMVSPSPDVENVEASPRPAVVLANGGMCSAPVSASASATASAEPPARPPPPSDNADDVVVSPSKPVTSLDALAHDVSDEMLQEGNFEPVPNAAISRDDEGVAEHQYQQEQHQQQQQSSSEAAAAQQPATTVTTRTIVAEPTTETVETQTETQAVSFVDENLSFGSAHNAAAEQVVAEMAAKDKEIEKRSKEVGAYKQQLQKVADMAKQLHSKLVLAMASSKMQEQEEQARQQLFAAQHLDQLTLLRTYFVAAHQLMDQQKKSQLVVKQQKAMLERMKAEADSSRAALAQMKGEFDQQLAAERADKMEAVAAAAVAAAAAAPVAASSQQEQQNTVVAVEPSLTSSEVNKNKEKPSAAPPPSAEKGAPSSHSTPRGGGKATGAGANNKSSSSSVGGSNKLSGGQQSNKSAPTAPANNKPSSRRGSNASSSAEAAVVTAASSAAVVADDKKEKNTPREQQQQTQQKQTVDDDDKKGAATKASAPGEEAVVVAAAPPLVPPPTAKGRRGANNNTPPPGPVSTNINNASSNAAPDPKASKQQQEQQPEQQQQQPAASVIGAPPPVAGRRGDNNRPQPAPKQAAGKSGVAPPAVLHPATNSKSTAEAPQQSAPAAVSPPPRSRSLFTDDDASGKKSSSMPHSTRPITDSPRHSPSRFNDDILRMLEEARRAFQTADEEARQLLHYLEPTPVKPLKGQQQ